MNSILFLIVIFGLLGAMSPMAKTSFASNDPVTKLVWEETLFREIAYEQFFSKFEGKGPNFIIERKEELEKGKGDQIRFTLMKKLIGEGITGSSGQSLEGTEEKLVTSTFTTYLEEYAHATRDEGPLSRQRAFFDVDDEAREAIKLWGQEKQEKLGFAALFTNPTKQFFALQSAYTSVNDLTAVDKITPAMLSWIKTAAITGFNRRQNPIRPVKINGKQYFVFLTHPDAIYDLRRNPEMQQALREAEVRGSENPIFSGADLIYDGVVVHSHELVPIGINSNTVPYAKGVLLGAQAMVKAWGKRPEIVAEEGDYKRWHGFGLSMMMKFQKATFTDNTSSAATYDFAVIELDCARTKVSDA